MTVRTDLVELLQGSGFRTDTTNTSGLYRDGICYVLAAGYDRAELAYTLTVVAAVGIGQSIDEYMERVWTALSSYPAYAPVDASFTYGSIPLEGRELPAADFTEITVVAGATI